VSPEDLLAVKNNIANTIGVEYEIIAFDNRVAKKGICQVYNEGIAQARFGTLCFMHEDVTLLTHDWGTNVSQIFQNNKNIGVVGVAGGGYKALAPSGWYCLEFQNPHISFQNIIQGYKKREQPELHAYHNPFQEKLSDVVCVDGVWFCARKEVAAEHGFDEKLLTGFHGYDLDFCLNLFGKHKIVVTYDILMRHESEGNFDKLWLDQILKVHGKWNKSLPLTTASISGKEIYFTEKRAIKKLIEEMHEWGYSFLDIQRMLLSTLSSDWMPVRLFLKAYLHFLKLRWKS
jgi:hypothetical protein